jgi:glycosyltransferase involved in cell wall biosynthesis
MPGIGRIVRSSDVVHTFEGWYAFTRQAALSCAKLRVPLVITHWDTFPYSSTLDGRARERAGDPYRIASCVLATTAAARRALVADGVAESKIVVQGMGVDTSRFKPGARDPRTAREIGIDPGDFVYLFVGRLASDKGIRSLIDAFEHFSRSHDLGSSKLLLIGSGPEQAWVQERARSSGLGEKILIHPPVAYDKIDSFYRLGDAFVFPSVPMDGIEEQFGYALVEAMSSALPIITTFSGGIPDVVGDAAVVVPPRDIEALSTAMLRIKIATAEREELRARARDRVLRDFSTSVVSNRLAALYSSLCRS